MLGFILAILCRAAARDKLSDFIRYAAIMVALRDTPYILAMSTNNIVNTQTIQTASSMLVPHKLKWSLFPSVCLKCMIKFYCIIAIGN